ncbi:MAG: thioesterase [Anaerolineales bacterium]|nr:thioesterase [Anaerolineales bacterium]
MDTWFACPAPRSDATMRVFFFPYAGGGPAAFAKWCAGLNDSFEGLAVHYPGRGSRSPQPPLTDLLALVENLSQAISPLLDKPFAFFGHSMGGLIAFELARTLRQKGLAEPNILFISACAAPQLPNPHPPIHQLPDAEFVNELKKLNGIPPEILQNDELMRLSLPTLRADFEMIETYQYRPDAPLACPLIALGGLDDLRVRREQLEGWAIQTQGVFESQYFAGDHFFITTANEAVLKFMEEKL